MCGIHGIITGKTKNAKAGAFVSDAFVAGQLRGTDSCGLAVISAELEQASLYKMPWCGTAFVENKAAKQTFNKANESSTITICHTRAATAGEVNVDNAHPFTFSNEYKELIGVHNGTLRNWYSRADARQYDVDSEWAYSLIFNKGLDAFKEIQGAFVFAWWDSDDADTLQFALNDERPMFVTFLEDGGMAYASEVGMLFWLLERNGIKTKGKAYQLTGGFHYQFKVGDVENFVKVELPKYVTPSYTSTTTTSYYDGTTMGKLDSVLGHLLSPKKPSLIRAEVDAARLLGVAGIKGTFEPTYYDQETDECYGHFYDDSTGDVLGAVIRAADDLVWDEKFEWRTSVIGAIDEKDNLTVVCGKPQRIKKQKQEVVLN